MAKALGSGTEAILAHSENRHRRAAASKIMKIVISLKSRMHCRSIPRDTPHLNYLCRPMGRGGRCWCELRGVRGPRGAVTGRGNVASRRQRAGNATLPAYEPGADGPAVTCVTDAAQGASRGPGRANLRGQWRLYPCWRTSKGAIAYVRGRGSGCRWELSDGCCEGGTPKAGTGAHLPPPITSPRPPSHRRPRGPVGRGSGQDGRRGTSHQLRPGRSRQLIRMEGILPPAASLKVP